MGATVALYGLIEAFAASPHRARASPIRPPRGATTRLRSVAGVYELHLAIKSPSPDDERAKAIVAKLSEQRQVEDLDGSWWRTDYSDFQDHGAAVHALHADLRAIDAHWGEVLVAGYMNRPGDTPEPLS